jgi:hypothetical protein
MLLLTFAHRKDIRLRSIVGVLGVAMNGDALVGRHCCGVVVGSRKSWCSCCFVSVAVREEMA